MVIMIIQKEINSEGYNFEIEIQLSFSTNLVYYLQVESEIFAPRAIVGQASEGLCYQRRNLTFWICLTWEKMACSELSKFCTLGVIIF